ncbi:NHL repeat-containing protein [Aspergillus steynii IBT 23096]|uniref:NHL repeat-containing protein n=1 Tax=Aspergillus steynii IBT 23096 TaxID=1392250 RepID=A0A2I2G0V9_9EURO|nr:NHL repeat-containing protein [Aspergillus steynii IBT 23096]PLB46501.1 NHL repeat-containing protein [Aspergillus steynii IBT 23096]
MLIQTLIPWALLTSTALSQSARQLFNFSTSVTIENSALRPNGHLLLTTFDQGRLYTLDPSSSNPQAELVASFPGATAISGIASIGTDKFAVVGGVRGNYQYDNETLYSIDLADSSKPINVVAHLPEAVILNGMAALPTAPHVVLISDSRVGGIFRVDTDTGAVDIAWKDELLTAPSDAAMPIGVNGLKVRDGYVYFTNTAQGLFGRAAIDDRGDKIGDVEVVTRIETDGDDRWDDFAFDKSGVAYVAQPDSALARIDVDGEQTVIVGGGNSSVLVGPTSVTLSKDEKTAYVTARGGSVGDVEYSGHVVEVSLSL